MYTCGIRCIVCIILVIVMYKLALLILVNILFIKGIGMTWMSITEHIDLYNEQVYSIGL